MRILNTGTEVEAAVADALVGNGEETVDEKVTVLQLSSNFHV